MKTKMRIDIVSDVVCPWCIVGFGGLRQALAEKQDDIEAEIHWLPFELNPQMPEEGQHLGEHMREKYGSSAEESRINRQRITERGAEVGFTFNFTEDQRMQNTLKAHVLLHWAGKNDALDGSQTQMALKLALFDAYFTDGKNINDKETLLAVGEQVGLDREKAQEILADQQMIAEVQSLEKQLHGAGIEAVPTFIFNQKYVASGGHPAESFVQILDQVMTNAE